MMLISNVVIMKDKRLELTWRTESIPFLLSGLTILVDSLKVILPARNSTSALGPEVRVEEGPNKAPPTAMVRLVPISYNFWKT